MLNYKSNEEENAYKNFYSKMNRIIDMGKKIMSSLEIENIMVVLKDEILKLNNADTVGIGIFDEKENNIKYSLYTKGKIDEHKNISLNHNNFLFHCFRKKKEVFINDVEESACHKYYSLNNLDYRIESLICIPLRIKNNAIGIVSIQSYQKNNYTIKDFNELKIISEFASIALENAYLFNDMKYYSEHDDLTGLLKRNKILDEGKKFSQSIVSNEDIYSLIMIDIDYFKKINDQYGHNIGDTVLKDISKIIEGAVRKSDFVGRYGGEEFLVILPEADMYCSWKIAERIRKEVEKYRYKPNENDYKDVTISVGIYQMTFKNNNFMDGLKKADKALYQAKNSGRNKSVIYKETV